MKVVGNILGEGLGIQFSGSHPYVEYDVVFSQFFFSIYKLLVSSYSQDLPPLCRQWEFELNKHFTAPQVDKRFQKSHIAVIATKSQDTCYKILTCWYQVPTTVHKWFLSVPNMCGRYGGAKGTMSYIWWECPSIRGFWNAVIRNIHKLTQTTTP